MEKTEFRAKAMRMAMSKIDVEREERKFSKPFDTIARFVMNKAFNPFINCDKTYSRYVPRELKKQLTFQSDPVTGLPSLDYSTLCVSLHLQATKSYPRLFQSFSLRGWLA